MHHDAHVTSLLLVCWKVLSGFVYIPIITSFGEPPKVVTWVDCFTTHGATWQREQDSPRPPPCCYSSYSRLFHAPWSDLSACRTDAILRDIWYVTKDVSRYKQMPSNPIISFWSQSFKAVDFSQLVCFGRFVYSNTRKLLYTNFTS